MFIGKNEWLRGRDLKWAAKPSISRPVARLFYVCRSSLKNPRRLFDTGAARLDVSSKPCRAPSNARSKTTRCGIVAGVMVERSAQLAADRTGLDDRDLRNPTVPSEDTGADV